MKANEAGFCRFLVLSGEHLYAHLFFELSKSFVHLLSPKYQDILGRFWGYHGRVVRGEMREKETWGSCIKGDAHSSENGLVVGWVGGLEN